MPRQQTEKVYVKVTSDFDATGYMQPKAIIWTDGRVFKIDSVRDFRPAVSMGSAHQGACYTIVIHGEERHLFFEKTNELFASRFGRWFVECPVV